MDPFTRVARTASALLLVLVVTTGWADASAASTRPAGATEASRASTTGVAHPTSAAAPIGIALPPAAASYARSASSDDATPDRSLWRPILAEPAQIEAAEAAPKPQPKPEPKAAPAPQVVRNHFWIPKLGMSYHVYLFECTRKRPPDNLIYRWGCAGTNNVYILGHAYGVMKPLHDLYVRGGLKVGMVAKYADRRGVVHAYRVTEWRVVDPVDSAWAIASQPVPSMTLQTCVGKDGRYRLNVRLVEV
jgi:hypothetical protein